MHRICNWRSTSHTVYNYSKDSCTKYAVVGFPVIGLLYGLSLSKGFVFSCIEYVISAPPRLLTYQTVYHPRDAFLLHWVCSRQSPSRWPIRRSTIIREMCFFCTEYAVISLPIVNLSDGLPSFKGCVFSALSLQSSVSQSLTYRTAYHHSRDAFLLHWDAVVSLLIVDLLGLSSFKGCVSSTLIMQSSVSQSLTYRTLYNHWISSYWPCY